MWPTSVACVLFLLHSTAEKAREQAFLLGGFIRSAAWAQDVGKGGEWIQRGKQRTSVTSTYYVPGVILGIEQ